MSALDLISKKTGGDLEGELKEGNSIDASFGSL